METVSVLNHLSECISDLGGGSSVVREGDKPGLPKTSEYDSDREDSTSDGDGFQTNRSDSSSSSSSSSESSERRFVRKPIAKKMTSAPCQQ